MTAIRARHQTALWALFAALAALALVLGAPATAFADDDDHGHSHDDDHDDHGHSHDDDHDDHGHSHDDDGTPAGGTDAGLGGTATSTSPAPVLLWLAAVMALATLGAAVWRRQATTR